MTAALMGRPRVFERGDKVYLTTPLTLAKPTAEQVEEYAFASAVKSSAPNENIGWLQGRYVEGNRGNLNNAMWLNDELAVKSMTPMLMPVTVMHDPRTAVGTIADCKLVPGENARIDNVLAIWRHRFPDIWEEAEANITDGTMMQSMECAAPWYSCSECGETYVKLHEGKEQSSWCEHLQTNSSRRILGDVCFTGTGLIFGTRGGKGAYTEAHLDHFQDEIAEFHAKAHIDGNYSPERSAPPMGFVQIDETELANLRKRESDAQADVRRTADEKASEVRELNGKVEAAEATATREKERADALETEKKGLEEKAQRAELKDKRWGALGTGFIAKLGEVTKTNLSESAASLSDEDWNARLTEVEELTAVKRDAKVDGKASDGKPATETSTEQASSFSDEELAKFVGSGAGTAASGAASAPGHVGKALARSFQKSRQPAKANQ